jgi:hypothetical protein
MEFKIGRFDDISLENYHKMEGYSKSALDKVHKSMAHYFENLESPKEQTEAMLIGSAFHCKVLTPDIFDEQYAVAPDFGDLRTKSNKEAFEEFKNDNIGKHIIKSDKGKALIEMSQSVLSHPVASQLLTDGDAEHSFFWIDKKTQLKCKCRPDYLRRDKIVIDLKSTDDASYFSFQRSIVNYRYHVQAAFFCDGITDVTKVIHNTFILIAVENKPPYAVAVYNVDPDAINTGRIGYQIDLDKIVEYYKSEIKWAGYPCMIQEMLLPNWVN